MKISKELIREAEIVFESNLNHSTLFRVALDDDLMDDDDFTLASNLTKIRWEIWHEVRFMFAYLILLEAGEE